MGKVESLFVWNGPNAPLLHREGPEDDLDGLAVADVFSIRATEGTT